LTEIIVWSWSLEDRRFLSADDVALLSAAEQERAARFVAPRHRRRFIAGRVGLRRILGLHTGEAPAALVFAENEFGKPYLPDHAFCAFSLSHSGDQAVLALADGLPIGVDIERVRAVEHGDIATRYFRAGEAAWIVGGQTEEEQQLAFFQAWTLKEAVAKAVGAGMSLPFSQFEIATAPPRVLVAPPGSSDLWLLRFLDAPAGHLCALAASGVADARVIQRTY
jgi:4'-phosphopantetheinyl transferase